METQPDLIVPPSNRASRRFSGDDLTHWAWTEPSVWTNPMLATLEHNGVRGGKWHSLMDKVCAPANLHSAYREVAANRGAPGVDNVTIEDFTAGLTRNIDKLEQQLRDGTYRPQSIKRVHIPKPGTNETRPLGIPTVRDRVVQNALRHVLEPILERQFAEHSYGFRPNRGCKDALRRVDGLVKAGYKYTVDVDLKSYFDTIPHDRLIQELCKHVADNSVIVLVKKFLQAEVLDGLEHWTPTAGAPQGAIISPLLSNLYLNEGKPVAATAPKGLEGHGQFGAFGEVSIAGGVIANRLRSDRAWKLARGVEGKPVAATAPKWKGSRWQRPRPSGREAGGSDRAQVAWGTWAVWHVW